ncbi:MAG: hypothetical protein IPJ77_04960 [Planctomycetes bacterium]|nr:hypothetical protein [Planctomycetota bacterium]
MGSPSIAALCALLASASVAHAQTSFAELEPNADKGEANAIVCLAAGDAITGVSTGGVVTPGNASSGSADTFRLQTCALAPGLYRHVLSLSSATPGHTATLRGLVQAGTVGVGGTATTIDATLSTAVGVGAGPRALAWYANGAGGELYYRVAGLPSTTQPYTAALSTTPVTPAFVGNFAAGAITITTEGQGHLTDTDLWLYDANFAPLPLAGNDDVFQSPSVQSRLVRTLAPGTYYVALSVFNLANHRTSPPDEDFVQGNLCDFAGVTATSSTLSGVDVSFALSDAGHVVPVTASVGAQSHEVAWFRFEVVPPLFEPFCFGDGTQPQPCPCGNNGGAGRGCANSANAQGALLVATGATNPDTVVLQASGMPGLAYALFLKGDQSLPGTPFGDGVRCVDGVLIRLRIKLSSGGVATYPEPGDPSVSVRGQTPPGSASIGHYQTYYRNAAAAFCPPETFNVTNGWRVVW